MAKTLYDQVGVSPEAPREVIHAAVRVLLRKFHPDNKSTGDPEMFRAIKAASEILENPERRELYDRTIVKTVPRSRPAKKKGRAAPSAYPPPYPEPYDLTRVNINPREILEHALSTAAQAAFDKVVHDNPILSQFLRSKR